MAAQLGLRSHNNNNNSLGYNNNMRGNGAPQGHRVPNAINYDDNRRGAYQDHNARADSEPVVLNRHVGGIAPTMPGGRGINPP